MGSAEVYLESGSAKTIPVYKDENLEPGHVITGPLLIRGNYLTCLIKKGWTVRVTPNNDLILDT